MTRCGHCGAAELLTLAPRRRDADTYRMTARWGRVRETVERAGGWRASGAVGRPVPASRLRRAWRTGPLVLVFVVALPLATAPAASAADLFRVSFKGGLAIAAWTTCPVWQLGEICQDTVVIASDARTAEKYPGGRERNSGPRVVLQRFVYEVVDLGGGDLAGRTIRESFGGTSDALVDIDRRSRSATASAPAIPMSVTEYRGDDSVSYSETALLHVVWIGQGELVAIDERDHHNDRQQLSLSFTKGWERAAVATGETGGLPIPGTLDAAATTVINASQGELVLYRHQA